MSLDEKVNPKVGKNLFKTFKFISLFLMIIGISVIAITFGALFLVDPHATRRLAWALTFLLWFIATFVSSLLWFYFSKWNV